MRYGGERKYLISRENRKLLEARLHPYWWVFAPRGSLGYRKGLDISSWYARVRVGEGRRKWYRQTRLGEAADDLTADGKRILSF